MSLLAYLLCVTGSGRNNSAKAVNAFLSCLYITVFALAVFLSVRDMGTLPSTTSKVWLLLLAVFCPEAYVIIHGLSSSSMGLPFFAEAPVDVSSVGRAASSASSSTVASSASSMASPVSALAAEIKKAAERIQKSAHSHTSDGVASSLSALSDSLSSY